MDQQLHKLLRIKRYEHPSTDYFERFLDEFHERQRAELLRRSTRSLIWERIHDLVSDLHVPRLAYAGVVAAAVIVSAVILFTHQGETSSNPNLAFAGPVPKINVMPSGQGDIRMPAPGRSDFPPHYVLEARPVSYESPYSF